MTHKAIATAALLLALCTPTARARQQSEGPKPEVVGNNNCEENRSLFDYVDTKTRGDAFVIIIARPGSGDRVREMNRRRLHNIREYLTYIREVPPRKIIVAEGERVKGRGRVEVYAGGRMVAVFNVGPNEDLNGVDCEGGRSTRYYPWRKASARR